MRRDAVRRGVLLVDVRYLPPKHGVERAVADVSTCALRVTGAPVRAGFRPIRARDALPRARLFPTDLTNVLNKFDNNLLMDP